MHDDAIAAHPAVDDVGSRSERLGIEGDVVEIRIFCQQMRGQDRKSLRREHEREQRREGCLRCSTSVVVGASALGDAIVAIAALHVVARIIDRIDRPDTIARRERRAVGKSHAFAKMIGDRQCRRR